MAPGRNPVITDDQILEIFRESEHPFLSSSELADELSLTRQGMNKRLRDLWERDVLNRKKCGNGYGWWFEEDGDHSNSDSNT